MCGRFTLTAPEGQLADEFGLDDVTHLVPRYNIAPTQRAAVVRSSELNGERELAMCKWGLIPHWAKDASIGSRMINARAETAAEKPAFRTAMKRHRCLVPATGFYEWKVLDPGAKKPAKQPYLIRRVDERVFAFAGLWDHWSSPDGQEIHSFTILTTEPNELMRQLHDRMPVIIPREAYGEWLDTKTQDVERINSFLRPYPASEMVAFPVSKHVNSPKFDAPTCVQVAG